MANIEQINSSESTSGDTSFQEIYDHYNSYKITGMVTMCVFAILGGIGNTHVLYIYSFKFTKSNHRLYILCLAVLDWTTCFVSMPFIIVKLNHPLVASNMTAFCSIEKLLNYFICCAVGLIMTVIAYDRYRKVCHPLRVQISYRRAKYLCLVALMISGLFTWPAVILFGRRNFPTKYGIEGAICFSVDTYKHYMLYFNVTLVVLLSLAGGIGILLYFRIGQTIFQLKNSTGTQINLRKMQISRTQTVSEGAFQESVAGDISSSVVADNDSFCKVHDLSTDIPTRPKLIKVRDAVKLKTTELRGRIRNSTPLQHRQHGQDKHSGNARRTSVMFLIITIIYLSTYIPFLFLTGILYSTDDFLESLNEVTFSLFYIFLGCFFFTNMINPIIYALCDRRYRKKLKQLYLVCCHQKM
ncbi:alpha-2Da adrenergic receptor-like [Ylistrum balloti]|uniref:alpha-2Da adrenergic receptor-like n=1 Tax=Ylistrum balloti TaxID=509963 RepID=UPI002905BA27|nr:alpha-2Da adrenergic receptor-like [Ylistrum balloti]